MRGPADGMRQEEAPEGTYSEGATYGLPEPDRPPVERQHGPDGCGYELVMLLERAGVTKVQVRGDHNDLPPTADDTFLLYLAMAG